MVVSIALAAGKAMAFSSLALAVGGFIAGFAAIYALDLFVHHGLLVGEKAEQIRLLKRHSRRGMLYLTVTDLVPEAEERQYQQVPGLAMGAGFICIFTLSTFL